MREAGWLKSDSPTRMLGLHRSLPPFADRKLRLFGIACCRRIWDLLYDERSRVAVEALERFVEGRETPDRMAEFARAAREAFTRHLTTISCPPSLWPMPAAKAVYLLVSGLGVTAHEASGTTLAARMGSSAHEAASSRAYHHRKFGEKVFREALFPEAATQADLLREIIGNPFRPVPFDPSWRTSEALELAKGIYVANDFDGLPILGDALEEAGCDRLEILEHCRRPGGHVRGCWAIDAVLGRSEAFQVQHPGTFRNFGYRVSLEMLPSQGQSPDVGTPGGPPGFWRTVQRVLGFGMR